MSWKSNKLTEILGIQVPIIQAPMAGSTTPELAAAVTLAKRRRLCPYFNGQVAADTREKHLAALARAGFSYDIARQVIDAESEEDLEQPS